MFAQLNRYSFLLALVLLGGLIVWQTWSRPRLRIVGVLAAVMLLAGWWLLRPGAGGSATGDTLSDALKSGQPVVVEVYSDY